MVKPQFEKYLKYFSAIKHMNFPEAFNLWHNKSISLLVMPDWSERKVFEMPSKTQTYKKVFVQIAITAILGSCAATSVYADRFGDGTAGGPGGTATVVAPGAPGKPHSLRVTPLTGSTIDVTWQAGSQDETGFVVETSTDGGVSWKPSGKTIAGTTEVPCSGLKPGSLCTVRVRAINALGESENSDTVTVATLGDGTGLTGTYSHRWPAVNGVIKVTKMFSRQDPYVNFNWDDGMDANSGGENAKVHDFLIVWTGQVVPLYSGKYTFYTTSDDGARLWINGQKLIENWTEHGATEDKGTIDLVAGKKYDVRLGYYENDSGGASISFSWSSDQQEKEIVPQSQLFPLNAEELAKKEAKTASKAK